MSKYDFDKVILNLDDKEIKDEKEKPITLKTLAVNALLSDTKCPGMEKLKKGKLAKRIYKGGEVDLTVKETSDLITQIQDNYNPLMVLRAMEVLEPEEEEKSNLVKIIPKGKTKRKK